MPDIPESTSPALTKGYHVRAEQVAQAVGEMLGRKVEFRSLSEQRAYPHDVPGDWFSGPF
jgi:pyruvate dehydrogenase E1 component beta subunit